MAVTHLGQATDLETGLPASARVLMDGVEQALSWAAARGQT
jgi:hypothetical protein